MATSRPSFLGRGFAFPFRVGPDGRIAASEGEANVRESIALILRTELGERFGPAFGAGLSAMLFEPNTVTTRQRVTERVTRSLAQHEPRIAVESVHVEPAGSDGEAALVTVAYRLVATSAPGRVTLSVPVRSGG